MGQVEVQNWLKKILWSRFLSLASALAQRCCRKDGKVPLLRPLGPTVPPTPETCGCWLLPVKHSRYEKLFAVTVQKVFTAHL